MTICGVRICRHYNLQSHLLDKSYLYWDAAVTTTNRLGMLDRGTATLSGCPLVVLCSTVVQTESIEHITSWNNNYHIKSTRVTYSIDCRLSTSSC